MLVRNPSKLGTSVSEERVLMNEACVNEESAVVKNMCVCEEMSRVYS